VLLVEGDEVRIAPEDERGSIFGIIEGADIVWAEWFLEAVAHNYDVVFTSPGVQDEVRSPDPGHGFIQSVYDVVDDLHISR